MALIQIRYNTGDVAEPYVWRWYRYVITLVMWQSLTYGADRYTTPIL